MGRPSIAAKIEAGLERDERPRRGPPPARDWLVTPGSIARPSQPRPWEGALERKPWQYAATAVIPHCNTPELLALCVSLLRAQTVPPYIVVVDTGTPEARLGDVLALRDVDLEVHQVNCHGVPWSSALVAMAMDVGQAVCQTEWLWAVHSDCLVTRRELLAEWIERLTAEGAACMGYQSIPRAGFDFWRGMVSHTCTLLHLPTLDDLGATWGVRRLRRKYAEQFEPLELAARTDTEIAVNMALIEAGRPPIIVGEETWAEIERDANRVHLRSYTSAVLHNRRPERFGELRPLLAELVLLADEWGWPVKDAVASRLLSLDEMADGRPSPREPQLATSPETAAEARRAGVELLKENTPELLTLSPPAEPEPRVTFIAPIWNYYPVLLESLRQQTDPRWRLLLYHDGPWPDGLRQRIADNSDTRVRFQATDLRFNDFGHSLRELGLNELAKGFPGEWVVITNGDNYYVPRFVERVIEAIEANPDADVIHSDMIHNYWGWQPVRTVVVKGSIDCGAAVVRRDVAIETGWPWREHAGDWEYLAAIARVRGLARFAKLPGCLFVHN